jgi:hypothetical protein
MTLQSIEFDQRTDARPLRLALGRFAKRSFRLSALSADTFRRPPTASGNRASPRQQ